MDLIGLLEWALQDLMPPVREFLVSGEGAVATWLAFMVLAGPRTWRILGLYQHYRMRYPLPARRRAHVRNVDIENVREAIRVYLLFLIYLTGAAVLKAYWWGPLHDIADALIQLSFLGAVLGKYRTVQQALVRANSDGSSNVGDIEEWLHTRLEGVGLSLSEIGNRMASVMLLGVPLLFVKLSPNSGSWISLSDGVLVY